MWVSVWPVHGRFQAHATGLQVAMKRPVSSEPTAAVVTLFSGFRHAADPVWRMWRLVLLQVGVSCMHMRPTLSYEYNVSLHEQQEAVHMHSNEAQLSKTGLGKRGAGAATRSFCIRLLSDCNEKVARAHNDKCLCSSTRSISFRVPLKGGYLQECSCGCSQEYNMVKCGHCS